MERGAIGYELKIRPPSAEKDVSSMSIAPHRASYSAVRAKAAVAKRSDGRPFGQRSGSNSSAIGRTLTVA